MLEAKAHCSMELQVLAISYESEARVSPQTSSDRLNNVLHEQSRCSDAGLEASLHRHLLPIVHLSSLLCPAGELSPGLAWVLVVGLAVAGITISARNFGSAITKLYALGLTLGTVYSVPPFRLKRFAIPAFVIIAIVRGFLLNFGVYSATRAALGLEFMWSPAIL